MRLFLEWRSVWKVLVNNMYSVLHPKVELLSEEEEELIPIQIRVEV